MNGVVYTTITVELPEHSDFKDWQPLARYLLQRQWHPDAVVWEVGLSQDLFSLGGNRLNAASLDQHKLRPDPALKVSKAFIELARFVASHQDSQRFSVLYWLLWRLCHGEKRLLMNRTDTHVLQAQQWAQAVRRDRHKMKAFVRFRAVETKDAIDRELASTHYVAWFEPEHYIVRLTAGFFRDRFTDMEWSILTPYQSVHWINGELHFTEGADSRNAPDHDSLEGLWCRYYASTFNPARLKVKAMCAEMPKKYWHNLPEAKLIPGLIQSAGQRTESMLTAVEHKADMSDSPRLRALFDRQQWLSDKATASNGMAAPSPKDLDT